MDIAFALKFVVIFAAAFYFLAFERKVKSLLALRLVWLSLTLSLATAVLTFALKGEGLRDMMNATISAGIAAYSFLAVACFFLPFVAWPIGAAARPRRFTVQKVASADANQLANLVDPPRSPIDEVRDLEALARDEKAENNSD